MTIFKNKQWPWKEQCPWQFLRKGQCPWQCSRKGRCLWKYLSINNVHDSVKDKDNIHDNVWEKNKVYDGVEEKDYVHNEVYLATSVFTNLSITVKTVSTAETDSDKTFEKLTKKRGKCLLT